MDLTVFRDSLQAASPPQELAPALRALWFEAKGNWHHAHEVVQEEDDRECAWVHAYLHRKEGDLSNAGYWYRRAGKPAAKGPLAPEWDAIVTALLETASDR